MYNPDTRKFENLMGSSTVAAAATDARKFENLMSSSIASHVAAAFNVAQSQNAANAFNVAQSQTGQTE